MATLKNGILHGKVGDLVYYTRNGVPCVRALPKTAPKEPTSAQLAQRQRLKLATQFLGPLGPMLNETFRPSDKRLPGINKAVRYTIQEAITGQYPDLRVAPARVLVSSGPMPVLRNPTVTVSTEGQITLSWTDVGGFHTDDLVYALMYNVSNGRVCLAGGTTSRRAETLTARYDAEIAQGTAHVWAFLMDRLRRSASNSVYLGMLVDGQPTGTNLSANGNN